MPAVQEYVVTQERQVRVTAESPSDAIAQAKKIFDGEDRTSPVIETGVGAETYR